MFILNVSDRNYFMIFQAVLQTVTSLLTNADASIGLANPIGVGQRPKPGGVLLSYVCNYYEN